MAEQSPKTQLALSSKAEASNQSSCVITPTPRAPPPLSPLAAGGSRSTCGVGTLSSSLSPSLPPSLPLSLPLSPLSSSQTRVASSASPASPASPAPMLIKQTMVSSCHYDDDNAAPLHLHALPMDHLPSNYTTSTAHPTATFARAPVATSLPLATTTTMTTIASSSSNTRSRSRSTSRSRSRSRAGSFSSSRSVSPSSSSSVATPRILDPNDDILLDKLGLLELQQLHHHNLNTPTASDDFKSSNSLADTVASSTTVPATSASASYLDSLSHATTQPPQIQLQLQQQQHSSSSHHSSSSSSTIRKTTLHSVNERMSDESLDDVHAFTDLRNVVKQIKIPSKSDSSFNHSNSINSNMPNTLSHHLLNSNNSNILNASNTNSTISLSSCASSNTSGRSREGSVAGSYFDDGNFLLETLKEFDDENEEEDDESEERDDETKNNQFQENIIEMKTSMNNDLLSMTITEE